MTLLEKHAWQAACGEIGRDLEPGGRRANLVVDGFALCSAIGRKIRVGGCIIDVVGETRPCRLMEDVAPGLMTALSPDYRGGVYGRVVEGGRVVIGAEVKLLYEWAPEALTYNATFMWSRENSLEIFTMLRRICLIFTLLSLACSVPSEEQPALKKAPQPAVTAVDQGHLLPSAGRTKVEFVENHLLGKEFLPGGNIAEYERDGKTFQQFLARVESPEKAGFRLLDFKGDLTEAKYIGHLGGYFGTDGDRPVLVFQRGRFVAGVIGLPQQEADSIARELALRLK